VRSVPRQKRNKLGGERKGVGAEGERLGEEKESPYRKRNGSPLKLVGEGVGGVLREKGERRQGTKKKFLKSLSGGKRVDDALSSCLGRGGSTLDLFCFLKKLT